VKNYWELVTGDDGVGFSVVIVLFNFPIQHLTVYISFFVVKCAVQKTIILELSYKLTSISGDFCSLPIGFPILLFPYILCPIR
jgi:hypothetical protein